MHAKDPVRRMIRRPCPAAYRTYPRSPRRPPCAAWSPWPRPTYRGSPGIWAGPVDRPRQPGLYCGL